MNPTSPYYHENFDKVFAGNLYEGCDINGNKFTVEVVCLLYVDEYTTNSVIFNVFVIGENDEKIEARLKLPFITKNDKKEIENVILLRKFEDVYPSDKKEKSYIRTSIYDLTEYIVKDKLVLFKNLRESTKVETCMRAMKNAAAVEHD